MNFRSWGIALTLVLTFSYHSKAQLIPYWDGKKVGLSTIDFKIVLKPNFDEIKEINYNYYLVTKGKYNGVVNPSGKVIIPPNYTDIYLLHGNSQPGLLDQRQDYFSAYSNSNRIYFDTTGKVVLKGEINSVDESHYVVRNEEKKALYRDGKIILKYIGDVEVLKSRTSYYYLVKNKDGEKLYTGNGEVLIQENLEDVKLFNFDLNGEATDLFSVKKMKTGKSYLYHAKLNKWIDLDFDYISLTRNNLFLLEKDARYKLFNIETGILSNDFSEVYPSLNDSVLVGCDDTLKIYHKKLNRLLPWNVQGSIYNYVEGNGMIVIQSDKKRLFHFSKSKVVEIDMFSNPIYNYLISKKELSDSVSYQTMDAAFVLSGKDRKTNDVGIVILYNGADFFEIINQNGFRFCKTDAKLLKILPNDDYIYFMSRDTLMICDFAGNDVYKCNDNTYYYEDMIPPDLAVWLSRDDKSWNNVPVFLTAYDDFSSKKKVHIWDRRNRKAGAILENKKWVVLSDDVDTAYSFEDDELKVNFLITRTGKSTTVYDVDELKLLFQISDCDKLDGVIDSCHFVFRLGAKYGIVNSKGKVIIEPKYDQVSLNRVQENQYYDSQISYNQFGNIVFLHREGQWSVFNLKSNDLNPLSFDRFFSLGDVALGVITGEKVGIVDSTGKTVVQPEYKEISYSNDGYFECYREKVIYPEVFDSLFRRLSEKHELVRRGEGPFYPFLVQGDNGNYFGYKNKSNIVVIPPYLTSAEAFQNNYALVTFEGKDYLLDTLFNSVFADSVNSIQKTRSGYRVRFNRNPKNYIYSYDVKLKYTMNNYTTYYSDNQIELFSTPGQSKDEDDYAIINKMGKLLLRNGQDYFYTNKSYCGIYYGNNNWSLFSCKYNKTTPPYLYYNHEKEFYRYDYERLDSEVIELTDTSGKVYYWVVYNDWLIEKKSDIDVDVYSIDSTLIIVIKQAFYKDQILERREYSIYNKEKKRITNFSSDHYLQGNSFTKKGKRFFILKDENNEYYFNEEGKFYGAKN